MVLRWWKILADTNSTLWGSLTSVLSHAALIGYGKNGGLPMGSSSYPIRKRTAHKPNMGHAWPSLLTVVKNIKKPDKSERLSQLRGPYPDMLAKYNILSWGEPGTERDY